MKKIIIVIVFILSFAGCSNKTSYLIEAPKRIEVLTTKFEYETGKCLANGVMAEYLTIDRGETIIIINEDDYFYYANINNLILAIDKEYIRTEKEEEFEEYYGYTKENSSLYSDLYLNNRIKNFSLNDKVKVIDEFADVLLVECEGVQGYMLPTQVKDSKFVYATYDEEERIRDNSSGSYTPSSPSEPHEPFNPQGQDGEDIQLAYNKRNIKNVNLTYEQSIKAKVLADETKAYIVKYQRDDVVYIVNETIENYEILVNGRIGRINKQYIRKDSEKEYTSWTAYTMPQAELYDDIACREVVDTYASNNEVKVLDEIDDIYVIELADGKIGYMKDYDISESRIIIYTNSEDTDDISTPSHISDGNSKPSSQPVEEPEWTEPVL